MLKCGMKKINQEKFLEVCAKSVSMMQAASTLGLHFNTFRRYALKLGCYKPNQGGKGLKKQRGYKHSLIAITNGAAPEYQTYKLKHRLIKAGLKQNKCDICGITDWLGKPLSVELNHINGDRNDHRLVNLQMLCPNCHSQTSTYRSKNRAPRQ